jgi:Na+/melibiose symporter-like transporter
VDLFIHHSKLSSNLFYVGQTVYLFWNAFNDPLFGFLQDANARSRKQAFHTRIMAVRYGGLAWACAFLFIWFPPTSSSSSSMDSSSNSSIIGGLHFALSICLYDAFLTLVEVSHNAILSEITWDDTERASFNSYAAALAGFGSFSSFLGQFTWDREALFNFRVCVFGLALLSSFVFIWSSRILSLTTLSGPGTEEESRLSQSEEEKSEIKDVSYAEDKKDNLKGTSSVSALKKVATFIRELRHHTNFWVFVVISCIQSFDCAFEKSSFALMLERLSEDSLSKYQRGFVISASFFFPWLVTLGLTKQIQQRGVYNVLRAIFASRFVICVLGYTSSSNLNSAAPFLLINRVSSELVCRISPLVLSDLVDEDRFLNRRTMESRSGSVVGSAHFFSKIASSLGPMMSFGFMTSSMEASTMRLMFTIIPWACVSMQLGFWQFGFTLKSAYLDKVKDYVSRTDDSSDLAQEV